MTRQHCLQIQRRNKFGLVLLTICLILIKTEQSSRCDSVFATSCEAEKCRLCAEEAEQLLADAGNAQELKKKFDLQVKAIIKLEQCYAIEKHPFFLFSAGAICQQEKLACLAEKYYGKLLREDPDLSKTIEETKDDKIPLYIKSALLDCKKREVSQNEPMAQWFPEGQAAFKQSSFNELFMTKDMVSPGRYIQELKNEHELVLKKNFPTTYRVHKSAIVIAGIGVVGAGISFTGFLSSILIDRSVFADVNQRGAITNSFGTAVGVSIGVSMIGIGLWGITEFNKEYSRQSQLKIPRYFRAGYANRPF